MPKNYVLLTKQFQSEKTVRGLPDVSLMVELCSILEISVNELLCGEVIEMKDYEKTKSFLKQAKKGGK